LATAAAIEGFYFASIIAIYFFRADIKLLSYTATFAYALY
jgi:hypothetical protein